MNTAPAKAEAPVAVVGGIGAWSDPDGDCQYRQDPSGVTIQVPGSVHVNSPELPKTNAPRIVGEVSGDFVAQVKVPGKIQPGTQPLPDFQFTFQGAGLLLWQDEMNYLRFERAALNALDRPVSHQLLLETRRDGKPGKPFYLDISEKPLILRIERRGSDVNCSFSSDGKTWIRVKSASLGFPSKLRVGVSASNLSPKSFSARFEDFSVDGAGGKSGKPRKP